MDFAGRKGILGLRTHVSPLLRCFRTLRALPQEVHWPTLLLSISLLAALLLCRLLGHWSPRPWLLQLLFRSLNACGNLLVLVAASCLRHKEVALLSSFQEPMPHWSFTQISLESLTQVLPTALLTAFLSIGT